VVEINEPNMHVSMDVSAPAPNSAVAMTFAGWSETEARQRIARLLATGWRAPQLALMFGVDLEEIDRLVGEHLEVVL
jgi:hypothetical protein